MPPSRTVAPYAPTRTPPASRRSLGHERHLPHFIPVTNPLERFNREIGRRTDVVGIFPDDASLIRLVAMLAIEANDCHEGRPDAGGGAGASPRRQTRRCQTTASTRGGLRAVSRYRLGDPSGRVLRARRARQVMEGAVAADADGLARLALQLGP